METLLRICALNMFEIVTLGKDIPVGKVTNIKPYFEGGLGSIANLAVEIFTSFRPPFNYTISMANSVGVNGCEGMIVKNQSDVAFAIVDFVD